MDKSKATLKTATTTKNAKQTYYDSIEASLKDAQRMVTSAGSTVSFADLAPIHSTKPDATTDYQVVVKGVVDIVDSVLNHTYQSEVCSAIFSPELVSQKAANVLTAAVDYCLLRVLPDATGVEEKSVAARPTDKASVRNNMLSLIQKKTRPD